MRALLSVAAAFTLALGVSQVPRVAREKQPYPKLFVDGSCTEDSECPREQVCAPELAGCALGGSIIVGGKCQVDVVATGRHTCPQLLSYCPAGCSKLPVLWLGCAACVCDVCPKGDGGIRKN